MIKGVPLLVTGGLPSQEERMDFILPASAPSTLHLFVGFGLAKVRHCQDGDGQSLILVFQKSMGDIMESMSIFYTVYGCASHYATCKRSLSDE